MLDGPPLWCRRRFYVICYPSYLVFFKGISTHRHMLSFLCLLRFFMPHRSLCLQFILPLVIQKHQLYFSFFSCDPLLVSIILCIGSLLFRFSCQTGTWTHHVSMWYPLFFPPICLLSYCFYLRTLILRYVLPPVQVIPCIYRCYQKSH